MTRFGAHIVQGSKNGYGPFAEARPSVAIAVDDGGALLEPSPGLAGCDIPNANSGYLIAGRNVLSGISPVQSLFDFPNVTFREFRHRVLFSEGDNRPPQYPMTVQHVVSWRYILKIFGSIVRLNSISVVYLMAGGQRPHKRRRNQSVNEVITLFFSLVKNDPQVSLFVHSVLQRVWDGVGIAANWRNSADIPKTTDLINSFVANYVSPFFFHFTLNIKTPLAVAQSTTKELARGVQKTIIRLFRLSNKLFRGRANYSTGVLCLQ